MKKKIVKIIGISLILIGIITPFLKVTKTKIATYNNNLTLTSKIKAKEEYYAILEIPKINLKRELYPINDSQNNVNQNVFVQEDSIFPSNTPSNVILAAHSGTGSYAYFKDLYKLSLMDTVNLYYQDYIYIYEIKEIEYQEKTGELYIKEEYENMLTLITCTYNDNQTQTIYYASLLKKTKID